MARSKTSAQKGATKARVRRIAAAQLFTQYLAALKAGADIARSKFGGTAIPVTVDRPVTDRVTRAVRIQRFQAHLEIAEDGIGTRIVPTDHVAFDLVDVSVRFDATVAIPGSQAEQGHPIWWKISGIPVEISRFTQRGKSMTAIVMEHLQVWAA